MSYHKFAIQFRNEGAEAVARRDHAAAARFFVWAKEARLSAANEADNPIDREHHRHEAARDEQAARAAIRRRDAEEVAQ